MARSVNVQVLVDKAVTLESKVAHATRAVLEAIVSILLALAVAVPLLGLSAATTAKVSGVVAAILTAIRVLQRTLGVNNDQGPGGVTVAPDVAPPVDAPVDVPDVTTALPGSGMGTPGA